MTVGLTSLALATLAAFAAWLTLGVQAVVETATRLRVGVLPPFWLLVALWAAFVGVAWLRRLPLARLWPLAITVLVCLPWLPGPVPAAFLIWYGPLAAAVWLVAVLGIAAPEIQWLWSAAVFRNPRYAPILLGLAALVLFTTGAWALRDRLPDGDEPHYLIITQSLLSDGDLRIENNHARGDYFPYHVDQLRPDYVQRGLNGAIYSIHAPGVSALVLPAFAIGGWPGAAVFMSVIAALTAVLLWRVNWRLTGGDATAAWVASAAFAFTVPGYFHAFTIFPDGAGAACVAIALWAIVRLELDDHVSVATLAAAGTALAVLPWLHTRFAVLAGGFGLILLLRLRVRDDRLRTAVALLAVPVVSAVAWFAFFWAIWGTPNPAAPYGQATQSAWAHLRPALPGLLFDQQFGLTANAPVYAASCLGLVALARSRPRLALELAALCVIYTVAVGTYRMWWGGHSAPARFLIAMLPLWTVPLAAAWTRWGAAPRALVLVLLTISIALLVPRVIVDGGTLAYNERDGYDLLLDWLNRSVSLPLAWPSLHRDVVAEAWRDIGIWALAATVICGVALVAAARLGRVWTWMCAAVAVTIMAAATLTWQGTAESVTPNASMLALLQRWPDLPGGSGWQSTPFQLSAAAPIPARLLIPPTSRGPAPSGPAPLWRASQMPAGKYDLVIAGERPHGLLSILVGSTTQALDVLEPQGETPRPHGLVLALPVAVRSLTIQGDDKARATVAGIVLRPREGQARSAASNRVAQRATRYAHGRVFFLDDNAFMEPAGFWTRGQSAAEVLLDAASPEGGAVSTALSLHLRAGPVPTAIELASGGWRQSVSLDGGETVVIPLPDSRAGGTLLRLDTRTGFRPAQHDAGNQDLRNLGVWVEISESGK